MFLLETIFIILVSFFITGLTIFKINKYGLLRYGRFKKGLEDFKKSTSDLENRLKCLETENFKLQQDAERIISLYEMLNELEKYLDEDKLIDVFCDKARQYLNFGDCRLIDESQTNQEDLRDYRLFDLRIKNEIVGCLAVKGLGDSDRDNFSILASQFALALKKARLYKQIQQLAITDSLTNVYTRRYILERAKEELQRSEKNDLSFSFLILDIDHFKDCNDRFGHLVGDVALRELSKIIKTDIRQIDLLGRFGGEEFCILLPETNKSRAYQAAERIRQAVEAAKIRAYDESISLSASIGIANFPEDADNLLELIDRSDWALYRAKQTGRNRICTYGVYE